MLSDDGKDLLNKVIDQILIKSRYSVFSKETIKSIFVEVSNRNPALYHKVLEIKNPARSKLFKRFVSLIKSKLYKKSAMYVKTDGHISLEERGDFPAFVVQFLKENKVQSIIDLGCGLNPLSFPFDLFDLKSYLAYDLNSAVVNKINDFLKDNRLFGKVKAVQLDFVRHLEELPKSDAALLFKVLDLIEEKGHKLAEKVILQLRVKYLIISFPLKTLS